MKRVLATIPFTLFGIATLLFFGGVSILPASSLQSSLFGVARVLIVPIYLVALAISWFMPGGVESRPLGVPAELGVVIVILLGLLPYVAADWALSRRRRSRNADA
jgi:hypothetical protein